MKGFFIREEKQIISKKTRRTSSRPSSNKLDCNSCGLFKTCQSPQMKPSGEGRKKILIIAEAPGKSEDEQGIQLVGQAGSILRQILKDSGYNLDRDFWKTNAVICRPKKNRTPTNKEINCCRQYLLKTIEELKPEKIITLGKIALQGLIGDDISITSMEKWTGWKIPDQKFHCWIYPIYHPSYLLRNPDDIILQSLFVDHIVTAITDERPFPEQNNPEIDIITNPEAACILLEGLKRQGIFDISLDIETTGIKPHAEGHQIKTISFSWEKNKAASFPIFYDNKDFMFLLKKVLRDKRIKKIAHNMKFEDSWIRENLGYQVEGWRHGRDTMLQAHVLNNSPGTSGLKFLTYVHFGIRDYSSSVSKFLFSRKKSANSFNDIESAPLNELLKYNALDSLYTYKLESQCSQLSESQNEAYHLLHDGALTLSHVESNGMIVDVSYFNQQKQKLSKKISIIESKIQSHPDMSLWDNFKGKSFDSNSTQHLQHLFFDLLKLPSVKQTKKGNQSVDEEALSSINHPIARMIIQSRKYKKMQDTYIEGFLREEVNGIVHPSFNLNTVKTYRSSSNNPNFQNIPKRDKEAQRIIRRGIIPRGGCQLLEVDYSGIEVRISACYHKDPVMINYIEDPATDMHRDMAQQLLIMDSVSKENRYLAKNNFVFPQFYGSYYVECAKNIWERIDKDTKEHLKSKGIKKYQSFENHVKNVEDDFWNNRFKVYNKWKRRSWDTYLKTGYIESLTGFIYSGRMKKNEVLNYPIQGSAFHCLLWSLVELNQYIKANKYQTKIIGQIHDAIVFDIPEDEVSELKPVIRDIMCQKIREEWKWIIVPLDIEADISEVNGNWSEMKQEEI